MPDLKAALTKVIADHQPDMERPCWANERWCRGCEQSFRVWPWSEFAGHQVDVLLALPGVAVIQLPEPIGVNGNDNRVWENGPNYIEQEFGGDVIINDRMGIDAEHLRATAGILLAAAVLSGREAQ